MNVGVEVEFTGIKRIDAANIVKSITYSNRHIHNYYNTRGMLNHSVKTDKGIWRIMFDRSIQVDGIEVELGACEDDYKCEIATPVILDDSLCLYRIMECLEEEGAFVNDTCGIHIHIDFANNADWVYNLAARISDCQKEDILQCLGVGHYRSDKYCKLLPEELLSAIKEMALSDYSREKLLDLVYGHLGGGDMRDDHKNPARYYWVNFDSIHKRNTVEFRPFNSTLSPKVLKGYISFVDKIFNVGG